MAGRDPRNPSDSLMDATSASAVSSSLKSRIAELRRAHAAVLRSAAAGAASGEDLQAQVCHRTAPPVGCQSDSAGLSLAPVLTARAIERTHMPLGVTDVSNAPERPALKDASPQKGAAVPSEAVKISAEQTLAEYTSAAPTTLCPVWGPPPHFVSKRRSSHTKWFSQARVTQR